MSVIGTTEQQQFAAAHAHFQAGRFAEALQLAAPLAKRLPDQADVQMLAGMAAERLRRLAEAERYYAAAMRARPGDPNIRNIHANSVSELGEHERALKLFEALLRDFPDHRDAHVNRAITAEQAGDRERAFRLCSESLQRFPDDPRLLATRGAIAKNAGRIDEAIADLERSAQLDPNRPRTHHNLAVALAAAGEAKRACGHFSRAVQLGMNDLDTAANWASALLEAGEVDSARALYQRIVEHAPSHAEAGRALSRLLREYDARDDAFGHYAAWAAREPDNAAAWTAWMQALARFDEWGQLKDVAARALERHPDNLVAAVERAFATGMSGEPAQAARALEPLAAKLGHSAGLAPRLMQLWLMAGEPARAAAIGEKYTAVRPADQAGWANLATAWAMLGDQREQWLCDYETLVRPVEVEPAGAGDPGSYAREIAAVLDRLHKTTRAPGDQSLRTGTQTSGALFDRRDPAIRAFRDAVLAAARRSVAGLPDDPSHPFLSRKSERLGFSGSWSVRLSTSGFHVAHYHGEGWMSSAYYARLPELTAEQQRNREGWIKFGEPPASFGVEVPARRFVEPRPGLMVLFPSYMWHATVPFSRGDRLTAAFDFVPA